MVINLKKIIISLICLGIILTGTTCYCVAVETERKEFFPTHSKYANWVFLGTVENEEGDNYNYFFQMQRDDTHFHVKAALFNAQTRELIFNEDSETELQEPANFKWMVGRAFLRYSKISNSWIFGLKNQHKQGFNFKVSMLNKPEDSPVTRYFQDGVSFVIAQISHLNGHVHIEEKGKDQFVTSKNTWFRQIWLKKDPSNLQSLRSLLCRFNDGRGLYSIRVLDSNNISDSISGLFDSEGGALRVSQFINLEKNPENDWKINVSTPKMRLVLRDDFQKSDIVAGYIVNESSKGFCLLTNDQIGLK